MKAPCRRTVERIETRARNDVLMAAAVADDFADFFPDGLADERHPFALADAASEADYYRVEAPQPGEGK